MSDQDEPVDEQTRPEQTIVVAPPNEPGHSFCYTQTEHRYNLAGQPDVKGPAWARRTIRPTSLTLRIFGTPEIEPDNARRVDQVAVQGKVVSSDGTVSSVNGEVDFFAGASRTDPLPGWLKEILESEGFRYGW